MLFSYVLKGGIVALGFRWASVKIVTETGNGMVVKHRLLWGGGIACLTGTEIIRCKASGRTEMSNAARL